MIVRVGVVLSSTFVNGLIVKRQRQPRRRLRKRHLKGEFPLFQTLLHLLIPTRSIRQMLAIFSGVEF